MPRYNAGMCVFCAAIPAAAALGAAAHGKQTEARRRAADAHQEFDSSEASPFKAPARPVPIAAITGVVIACLMVGSVVTHATTATGT